MQMYLSDSEWVLSTYVKLDVANGSDERLVSLFFVVIIGPQCRQGLG